MDFKKFSNLIMIEQTLFALPFAYIGILFAGGASLSVWVLATIALASARTSGMLFNRVLDADIDAQNPRTAERLVPLGRVSKKDVWAAAAVSSAVFILSAYFLNDLCFYLSFPALFMLFTYSLFKRFSASSHFYLGLVEAAAPIGGYIAARGELSFIMLIPAAAILFWIAGIDILYALQDMNHDRKAGLFSIPSRLGAAASYAVSRTSYVFCVAALIFGGITLQSGFMYYFAVTAAAILLISQQDLAEDIDNITERMPRIFGLNRYISLIIFAGLAADIIFR